MDEKIYKEIEEVFLNQIGLKAKFISLISFNQWIIETESGDIYRMYY